MTTCPGCEQEVYADLLDDGRLRCRTCEHADEPAAFQDPLPAEDRVLADGSGPVTISRDLIAEYLDDELGSNHPATRFSRSHALTSYLEWAEEGSA